MSNISPKLPRITRILLVGYYPIFTQSIEAQVANNRLLILGGNGLGKTTILQSVIYCIAGESDLDVEILKVKRWGRNYFMGRIFDLKSAYVEIEFFLGNDRVTLRRGFKTHSLLEFWLNGEPVKGKTNAEMEFENYLRESAGYQSLIDFRFVIHKLCYLPEDRSNLVWDSENQMRLIMLLFADLINEAEFNEKRKQLKQIDSKKRHKNVDLNDAKKELKEFSEKQTAPPGGIEEVSKGESTISVSEPVSTKSPEKDIVDETEILRDISALSREKLPIQGSIKQLRKELSEITLIIEDLQNQLSHNEENFILEQLNHFESEEVKLAIHKLIHRHICPACGEKADNLAGLAVKYTGENRCPLCGSNQGGEIIDRSKFPLLDAQLSEKIRQKLTVEKLLLDQEKCLQSLIEKEEDLQFQLNKIKISQSQVDFRDIENEEVVEDDLGESEQDGNNKTDEQKNPLQSLQSKVEELEREYQELDYSFERLRSELERKYEEFTKIAAERMARLGELYEDYATKFLGLPCQLETRVADVKFLSLNLYVPKFDEKIRERPDTCSEAQRFFLDIAFRMAVIDLTKELSQCTGSFICETPENALDITYINNVASMFQKFSAQGHTLIATGNLQPAGLAGPILFDIPKPQRAFSVLNLLDYGRLSVVQRAELSALRGVLHDHVINFEGGGYD